jgi:hypothetical protein
MVSKGFVPKVSTYNAVISAFSGGWYDETSKINA